MGCKFCCVFVFVVGCLEGYVYFVINFVYMLFICVFYVKIKDIIYGMVNSIEIFVKLMKDVFVILCLLEQLCDQIEERIVIGIYSLGICFDEQELVSEFGVLCMLIREVFIQLFVVGLIEVWLWCGVIVMEIDLVCLCEMFDVMVEFEVMCGSLVVCCMMLVE